MSTVNRLPIKLGLGFLLGDSGEQVLADRARAQRIADEMAKEKTKQCAPEKKSKWHGMNGRARGFQWHGVVWSCDEYHRISLAGQPHQTTK